MELWWVGCAQVPSESHKTLKWLFSQTNIPNVIQGHHVGELLNVKDYGNFQVEWHLSGDLKTLKCMFGISGGANSKYPCLYCMQSPGTNGWMARAEGEEAPSRQNVILRNYSSSSMIWDPIRPIALTNVHICTLHAELRIIDKLVRLQLDYAYSIKPTTLADECIKKCECLLSKMGFHGGDVHLRKDPKLSQNTGDVLEDVSMGGAKARRFFSNHDGKQL
ncbi:hypothetical protein KP509_12G097000 [Ceratopteris richardii]|uniref:Uncharacterized protein n=1 Tax=Ceratopteris richardii TaxID=49495 RepID=A0A8T2TS41_CERRI|nr:hypothetical protein KP509_12G097000 [Ceratopteris richardii]